MTAITRAGRAATTATAAAAIALAAAGCSASGSDRTRAEAAGAGALVGAAAGAAIGGDQGSAGAGALVGVLIGGAIGLAVGDQLGQGQDAYAFEEQYLRGEIDDLAVENERWEIAIAAQENELALIRQEMTEFRRRIAAQGAAKADAESELKARQVEAAATLEAIRAKKGQVAAAADAAEDPLRVAELRRLERNLAAREAFLETSLREMSA